ncbi:hypothetical protein BD626DRAFT_563260 [Schizophyllum amplum]|uniref:Uncharacterized protein n=1 Tax=Schizophyllum amplum TaxID=97359 RepID=A0A550CXK4_9AGAR|nr:hypothetical protein BD626DRAFT_563260 [Auriculariopsis ampla]
MTMRADGYWSVEAQGDWQGPRAAGAIVALSSDVHDYARNAGGTLTSSDYVDIQVENIGALVARCQTCVDDLRAFDGETKSDQGVLKERSKAINTKLVDAQGTIGSIRTRLQDLRGELKAKQDEYEQAKIIACTSLTYAWVFPVGTIVAASMAGVCGAQADQLYDCIDKVRELITDSEGKVRDRERTIASLETIDMDLDEILALIDPAVTAIQKMLGDMANKDVRKANQFIADTVETKVLEMWDNLATSVDNHRRAAYISSAEEKSLDNLWKTLKGT